MRPFLFLFFVSNVLVLVFYVSIQGHICCVQNKQCALFCKVLVLSVTRIRYNTLKFRHATIKFYLLSKTDYSITPTC